MRVLEHAFDDFPTVVLSNGIKVANFSSPHPFKFTDGSILEGCSAERAERLMLEAEELKTAGIKNSVDIELTFRLTVVVRSELFRLGAMEDVEIILVPLPVMTAWKAFYGQPSAQHYRKEVFDKIRCCRVADRMTKVIYADRFCK